MNRDTIIKLAREAGIPVAITAGNPSKEQIERFYRAAYAAGQEDEWALWAKSAKINIPTDTMEQQFSVYYRRGFKAGHAEAQERMKAEGWRQCAVGQGTSQHCGQLEAAVLAEREACAELCDGLDDDSPDGLAGWQYAAAIRARTQEAEKGLGIK